MTSYYIQNIIQEYIVQQKKYSQYFIVMTNGTNL